MREIDSSQRGDHAPDDRLAALKLAAAEHDVPAELLSAALEAAESASRHRVRAVSANRIDELVTQLAGTSPCTHAQDVR